MGDLEAIRERHRQFNDDGVLYCDRCRSPQDSDELHPWPCDTAVALAEVERLRGVVEAARSGHVAVDFVGARLCQKCSTTSQHVCWPCPVVAALGGEDG